MNRKYSASQPSSNSHRFNEMALEEALRSEQVKILYSSPVAMFSTSSLLPSWLWCYGTSARLGSFSFGSRFSASLIGARFIDQKRYLARPIVSKGAKYWCRRYAFGCAATGALWGGFAVSVDLTTSDPIYRVFMTFVIGGMIAGAILQHGAYLPAFYAYAGFALIPPIVAEFWYLGPCIAWNGLRHGSIRFVERNVRTSQQSVDYEHVAVANRADSLGGRPAGQDRRERAS